MAKTASTLPAVLKIGRMSLVNVVALADFTIAPNISGAKMATQSRSHTKVPTKVAATRPMTPHRKWSLGKGERWMSPLSSGENSQAAAATEAATTKTDKNKALF